MECPVCKSSNPDDKKFCGDCGTQVRVDANLSEGELRKRIKAVISEELKDQNVVEVEVTERIVDRVSTWARLLGYFAGIPLALLLLVLGGVGVKKYSDLWQLADAAESKIKPAVENASKQAENLSKQTEHLRLQTEAAQKQLADIEPTMAAIRTNSARIEGLQKVFSDKVDQISKVQETFDKRVTGIQGEVNQIKKAIDIVGKKFTPEEFRQYVTTVDFSAWDPKFVVLHNTGTPKLSEWHKFSTEQRMQNLAAFYGEQQHFKAGPHLIIDDEGIWVFSPLTRPGSHAVSWNLNSIGIMMVGNYEVEPLDDNVRDNTVQAVAILDATMKVDATTLRLHREDPKTSKNCPGKNIDKGEMIRRVQALLSHK